MKSKKKRRNFETYTSYSCFADEEQKKERSQIKIILLEGAITFLISLKGEISKKSFGKPGLDSKTIK